MREFYIKKENLMKETEFYQNNKILRLVKINVGSFVPVKTMPS